MPDVDKRAAEIGAAVKEADKRRADEADKIDKLIEMMSYFKTSMDSAAARMDSFEARLGKQDAPDTAGEADTSNKMKSNGQKPGAPRQLDDIDEKAEGPALAAAQLRADGVAAAFSQRAPAPMTSERPVAYRKRLLRPYLGYSKEFKAIDLETVSSEAVLAGLETRIYADAVAASCRPDVPEGQLYERQSIDASGRKISTFFGEPRAWMSQFAPVPGRLVGFNTKNHG